MASRRARQARQYAGHGRGTTRCIETNGRKIARRLERRTSGKISGLPVTSSRITKLGGLPGLGIWTPQEMTFPSIETAKGTEMLVIRLTRAGAKAPAVSRCGCRPRFRATAASEKVGTYNRCCRRTEGPRQFEPASSIVSKGAQPSDRVTRFLDAADIAEAAQQPGKGDPRAERAGSRSRQGSCECAEASGSGCEACRGTQD